jgi:hypothetical protein
VVAGEAYVGDERVDRGDYALIGRGDDMPEVSSDAGVTLFLRVTDRKAGTERPGDRGR